MLRAAALDPELRAMPSPVARSSPHFEALSRRDDVHAFLRIGCGRDFPPCVLDDELLAGIELHIKAYGIEHGAHIYYAKLPRRERALIRAAARNVERLKAQGVDLWAL